ncbi:hypothetical protein [Chitinophaga sp. Cy-1792]|uniref:hypothetical protein n=1 Tax=Chitinophaga sp. Cy-1792 TaxID=2608339 RepID=UPI00141FCB8B|nr:hypothetical protein [Chitinophaga sp. Cy-1792]NIG57569.1 hypothetical protein [Chitinophaga sp. Cy-1792]
MKYLLSTFLLSGMLLFCHASQAQITRLKAKVFCDPQPFFKPYVTADPAKGDPLGPAAAEITIVNPVKGSWNVWFTGTNGREYLTNYKYTVVVDGSLIVWQADMLVSDHFESVAGTPKVAVQPFSEHKTVAAKIILNPCTLTVEVTAAPIGTKRYTCTLSPANILSGWSSDGSLIAITLGNPVYGMQPN